MSIVLRALLAVLLLTGAAAAQDYPKGQLPTSVTPTHYAIDLVTRPDQNAFSGQVTIDVTLEGPTKLIWLHGQELKVREAHVTGADGKKIAATWNEIPDSDGVASLTLASEVRGPSARVFIRYDADYNRQLEGLYRADDGGEAYLYSQMETIFARRAFPSFDEPRFKTPFDISMTVRAKDTAISNAPIAKEQAVDGGLKRITFATTKPLPTYLIALIAGPFDVVQGPPVAKTAFRDREIPVRGVATKGKGKQLKYALDNTPAILGALENYFGTAYPYEKLDIIAVTDFAYGAMENAGAITYREQLLLIDENSSLAQRRSYALVHAHELAHQWFGNLVTPAWWNDIWLNEAFATWMGNKAAAAWDPKGEFGRLTLTGALDAMGSDSWHAARAIAQPILSNDDIQNAFDSITYEKGGGVLAMFEQFYNAENFRKGVALHLERKAWGVATAKEFLQSVADANKDSEGVAAFESFLNQPGVPLLTARYTCEGALARLEVSQSRYFQATNAPQATPQRWAIPTCVAFGQGPERDQMCVIIKEPQTRIGLDSSLCPTWVMPNADGAGYFRFTLDETSWDALARNAAFLTEKEVLSALDSMDAAFMSGRMDFDRYLARLRMVFAVRQQGPGLTWDMAEAVSGRLSWFDKILLTDAVRPQMTKIVGEMYGPLYQQLGLDPTSDLDKSNPTQATLMRSPVVDAVALQARLAPVRAELTKRAVAYLGAPDDGRVHPEAVDPDLLDEALQVAAQDRPAFAKDMLVHLKTERSGIIRQRLLSALTRATDPAVAAQVRALALSDELRTNEISAINYGMMSEPQNRPAAWAWFKENFDALKKRIPPNNRAGLIGVGSYFCSNAEADEYEKFITPRVEDVSGAPRSLASTLERIKSCATLLEAQRPIAVKALSAP